MQSNKWMRCLTVQTTFNNMHATCLYVEYHFHFPYNLQNRKWTLRYSGNLINRDNLLYSVIHLGHNRRKSHFFDLMTVKALHSDTKRIKW